VVWRRGIGYWKTQTPTVSSELEISPWRAIVVRMINLLDGIYILCCKSVGTLWRSWERCKILFVSVPVKGENGKKWGHFYMFFQKVPLDLEKIFIYAENSYVRPPTHILRLQWGCHHHVVRDPHTVHVQWL
jgi:hypothetical protein